MRALSISGGPSKTRDIVEGGPSLVERSRRGLPTWVGRGQQAPRNFSLENIQDRIDDEPSVRWWSAKFFGLRKHRHEELPLSVGEIRIVDSVFHAPTAAAPKMGTIPTNCPLPHGQALLCTGFEPFIFTQRRLRRFKEIISFKLDSFSGLSQTHGIHRDFQALTPITNTANTPPIIGTSA
jgi:hypothetical protein